MIPFRIFSNRIAFLFFPNAFLPRKKSNQNNYIKSYYSIFPVHPYFMDSTHSVLKQDGRKDAAVIYSSMK